MLYFVIQPFISSWAPFSFLQKGAKQKRVDRFNSVNAISRLKFTEDPVKTKPPDENNIRSELKMFASANILLISKLD